MLPALNAGATAFRTAFQCSLVCPVSMFVPPRNCSAAHLQPVSVSMRRTAATYIMPCSSQRSCHMGRTCIAGQAQRALTGSRKEYWKRSLSTTFRRRT